MENKNATIQHVFIVGSKGIPGNYGGYETFVDKLTEYHQNNDKIKYHVACKGNDSKETYYNNARCFYVKVPNIGPAQAIYYDVKALQNCVDYIKTNNINSPIIYILACRIGPFAKHFLKQIHKLGGRMYVNPDGHEWKRTKWSLPVRKYWKISERLMVKYSDLLICDSVNIEKYIRNEYNRYDPTTIYISYGSEVYYDNNTNKDAMLKYEEWMTGNNLENKKYFLIVGRFVPENNYETMIHEFMKSNTEKKLVIICNENDKLERKLKAKLHYESDDRILFVGTVYDKDLLAKIRKNAFAYIHGHEVGGTNPSLLEALGCTDLNLLIDVGFNREVAGDSALYWNKDEDNLKKLIEMSEKMSDVEVLGKKSKKVISDNYSWHKIAERYYQEFVQREL